MAIWAFPGIHVFRQELMFQPIRLAVGEVRFSINSITIAAIVIAILAYLLLHRTLLGIRIRAAGENPIAVDVAGVSVGRIRLLMCIVGGALAGLGGAFMPLAWFGGLVKEISAGRGFIALAAVVFAGLDPLLALVAAFIFGFSEGLAYTVVVAPGVKEVVPFYFVEMIPYVSHCPGARGRRRKEIPTRVGQAICEGVVESANHQAAARTGARPVLTPGQESEYTVLFSIIRLLPSGHIPRGRYVEDDRP